MCLPLEVKEASDDLNKQMLSFFSGERDGYCHVGPKKFLLNSKYPKHGAGYYNMELRPDDVWVVTFPRSGTTWAQELVWLVNNNLDYDRALKEKLVERFPFLELSILLNDGLQKEIIEFNNNNPKCIESLKTMCEPGYEACARMKSPRHIKSHFPLSLLPPKLVDTCKVIYVARNPKDVAVSYYYQNRLLKTMGFQSDFSKYWDLFQRNSVLWTPFWSHIEEAWNVRNNPNMLFLFYEDMKKDLPAVIHKLGTFLNKSLTEEQVAKLADHLDIKNLRKNPSMQVYPDEIKGMERDGEQGYIRQGQSGTWRIEFTPEMNAKADAWIRENQNKIGVEFKF